MSSVSAFGRPALLCETAASTEPADAALPQTVRQAAETVRTETRNVAGSLTAAREAAEILAGMDPVLRERILHAAATAVVGKPNAQR